MPRSKPQMSDTDVSLESAEQKIQVHLDKVDLYQATSKHEKRLLRCVKDLASFIAEQLKVEDNLKDEFWLNFRTWIKENNVVVASQYADQYIAQYLNQHSSNVSCCHTLRLHIQVFLRWNIEVSLTVREQVNRLDREQYLPAKIVRFNTLSTNKTSQFERFESVWEKFIEYMTSTKPEVFQEHLKAITTVRGNVPSSIFSEIIVLSNKSNDELKRLLLRTRALSSLLRATGMRGTTALSLTLDDFTEVVDQPGQVLLHRIEKKCGSVRNAEKTVFVCLVPHKNPRLDPLIHLAEYLNECKSKLIFAEGFIQKQCQDEVSFKSMIQRRFIATMTSIAIAIEQPTLFDAKKLHLFRIMCTNVLDSCGATAAERETHLGWKSTIETRHYTSPKYSALNSRTSYLLAGRLDKGDSPHPMWQAINLVPQSQGATFWHRVRDVAAAAGFVDGQCDEAFKLQVAKMISDAAITPPKAEDLLKRVRELELELAEVAPKKQKVEIASAIQLRVIINSLRKESSTANFPEKCESMLNEMIELIDEGSERDSFVLPQSDPEGKDLIRILVLAAMVRKFGFDSFRFVVTSQHKSWLGWLRDNRATHEFTKQISSKSWSQFKKSLVLI